MTGLSGESRAVWSCTTDGVREPCGACDGCRYDARKEHRSFATRADRYRGHEHAMQRQLTPAYVLDAVRSSLGGTIGLDPCTEPDNPTGAERFYTVVDDGLVALWCSPAWDPPVYVNPPYGRARERWVKKCIAQGDRGQRIVLLIPAHTDTLTFQQVLRSASAVCFVRGRVKFGVLRKNRRQEAASHPSALLGWNVDLTPCVDLGAVLRLPYFGGFQDGSGEPGE